VIERVAEHAPLIAPIVASIVRKSNRRWLSWKVLTQAGFVGLLEACHGNEYDSARSSFPTYASRKIEWAVLDAIKVEYPAPQMHVVGELPDIADRAPLPDSVYALREALASLSARQREVLEMRLSGYTQEMIALQLGISRVAVTQLQTRARLRLRQGQRPILRAA
jgi:RNA polymerase sigma factor (sigma-70 family)